MQAALPARGPFLPRRAACQLQRLARPTPVRDLRVLQLNSWSGRPRALNPFVRDQARGRDRPPRLPL